MDTLLLHRFEQPARFVDMLAGGKIWLSSPSHWPDPYESAFLDAKLVRLHALVQQEDGRFYSGALRFRNSVTRHWISENCLRHRVFAMCFSAGSDSERMWIAARAENRLRWSIDPDRLMAAVGSSSAFAGLSLETVEYRSTEDVQAVHKAYSDKYAGVALKGGWWDLWRPDVLVPLRTKRLEFQDERERRLIILDNETNVIRDRAGVEINVPLAEIINEVTLHPSATSDELQSMHRALSTAGYKGPVSRSSLYQRPIFDNVIEKPIQLETKD